MKSLMESSREEAKENLRKNLALQAFATDQDDYNFSSMGTFTP